MWSVIPGICPPRSSLHGMSSYTDTARFPSRFRRESVPHPSSASCRSVIGPFAKKTQNSFQWISDKDRLNFYFF